MQDRKTAEAGGKKTLGPRGQKKCPLEKKIVGWNCFWLVGGKNVGCKKMCRLENFTCLSRECPDIPKSEKQQRREKPP